MIFNSTQTKYSEELFSKLDNEHKEMFHTFLEKIPMLNRLVKSDRKRTKDLQRIDYKYAIKNAQDKPLIPLQYRIENKIVVDLSNPHILEDMDYFRPAAIYFQQHGCYTHLYPNKNPQSEYAKFWAEERRRCLEGYYRESDGEWISGYNYFYWNYSPIQKDVAIGEANEDGSIQAERVTEFGDIWDSDYWYFHYIEQGERAGKHGDVLKCRGRGYSFKGGSMDARNAILIVKSKSYSMAFEKEYLIKDGIINKAVETLDWCAQHTPWPRLRNKNSIDKLHIRLAYKDEELNIEKGQRSDIIGVTLKDDAQKAHPYSANIITPNGIKKWGDIKIGDEVFGSDGTVVNVIDIFEQGVNDIYEITFNDGRKVQCTLKHLWNVEQWKNKIKKGIVSTNLSESTVTTEDMINYLNTKTSKINKLKIKLNGCVNFKEQSIPMDAYTLGLMLGDGSIGKSTDNKCQITMMYDDINSIKHLIPYKVNNFSKEQKFRNTIDIPNGRTIFKDLNLFDKRSGNKFIPDIYKFNSEKVRLDIINGLLDTDGSITKDFGVIEFSSKSKQLAEDFIWIVRSLGFGGSIKSRVIKGIIYYRCYIYCLPNEKRLFNLQRKKDRIQLKKNNNYALNKAKYIHVESIKLSHQELAKCIKVSAKNSLYLIEDYVVTHNTRGKRGKIIKWEESGKFPGLKQAWKIAQKSLEQGNNVFGYQIAFGTGGTEGADFEAAEEFFYHPDGYKILALENIYDLSPSGKCALFIAEYMNRSGCYDKNGNSDVIKALLQILYNRQVIKHGSNDPNTIIQECAESPITPQEAVMRVEGSMFPVYELKQVLAQLRTNSKLTDECWIGRMEISSKGIVEFKDSSQVRVIDKFPHQEQKPGAIQIWSHPVRDSNGELPRFRYIAGCDPVDDDGSGTNSLLCTWIMNSLTGQIVAEYTGRPQITEEYFEQQRRLLMYYGAVMNYENNKKGLFTYFSNKNTLHLLCETPEILRDTFNVTLSKIGNKRFGTSASAAVNNYGLNLTKKWLLTPAANQPEDAEEPILNLHTLRSPAFIEELIAWNTKGNFDRVSAFGMLMIYREDIHKIVETMMNVKQRHIAQDPFWFKNQGNSYNVKNIMSFPK